MKLLKNLGWFLLALLSFFFIYGFIQGLATASLALGASPYAVTLLYVVLAGVYICVRHLQMVSESSCLY
ncbi:caax amino protease family protein [Streptococcus pneumoniae]|nr:caax amino protease family protein [Streptococcus pneumoniae]